MIFFDPYRACGLGSDDTPRSTTATPPGTEEPVNEAAAATFIAVLQASITDNRNMYLEKIVLFIVIPVFSNNIAV